MNNRLASIDVFRALIMLLMIFVIDLGFVSNIPGWLNHAAADEDRMGLADIVFPCFMFLIGLSIPHALKVRLNRGDNTKKVLLHILSRSASLIIMGLFVVNMDNMDAASMIIAKSYWQLLMVVAVFMIWNDYKSTKVVNLIPQSIIKILGWALLGLLAFIYKGPSGSGMQIYWWGILGLLGWSYGVCALLYLFIGSRLIGLGIAACIFLMLNVNEFIGSLDLRLVISASNYFCVMLGVLSSVLYCCLCKTYNNKVAFCVLLCLAFVLIAFGFLTRPVWEVSKIRATPSWASICSGISIILLLIMIVIADIQKYVAWAKPIAAGGYATLTCYFALYFVYSILDVVGFRWPEMISNGTLGLLKAFCFSLLIIQLTAWAVNFNLKLNL